MTTDTWDGTGDWNVDPVRHWSLAAPPTATTPAEILQQASSTISTSGEAASLQIDKQGTLKLTSGATATIGGESPCSAPLRSAPRTSPRQRP